MLRHVVMFKKKEDTSDEKVREIMERLEGLKERIPVLRSISCHLGMPSERPVVFTFLLDSTLDSAADLPSYLNHPDHVAVNEWMSPFLENRAVVDYEE